MTTSALVFTRQCSLWITCEEIHQSKAQVLSGHTIYSLLSFSVVQRNSFKNRLLVEAYKSIKPGTNDKLRNGINIAWFHSENLLDLSNNK